MRIHLRSEYTKYPLSEKLSKKSQRFARLTHPFFCFVLGSGLGVLPGFVVSVLFPSSFIVPMLLFLSGIIAGPPLMLHYREKKFAGYDEEYEALLKQIQESGMSTSEYLFEQAKSQLPPSALEFCNKNADNLSIIKTYLKQVSTISERDVEILLDGYQAEQRKHFRNHTQVKRENPNKMKQEKYIQTVFQRNPAECAAACLCMILGYYGKKVSLDQICEKMGVTSAGSSAGDIVRTAKQYGLTCHGYKTDAAKLMYINTPVVIHWCNNHFLILEEIVDDEVYLNDPAIGRIRINFAALLQNYSGVILVFEEDGVPFNPPEVQALVKTLQPELDKLVFQEYKNAVRDEIDDIKAGLRQYTDNYARIIEKSSSKYLQYNLEKYGHTYIEKLALREFEKLKEIHADYIHACPLSPIEEEKYIDKIARCNMKRFGECHRIWNIQKAILKEKYGVVWYTLDEINPDDYFD